MLKKKYDSSITSLKTINLHHSIKLNSEIYNVIQMENGDLLLSLGNGTINFFKKDNFLKPYYIFEVDKFPITNIIQLENESLICTSSRPSICIVNKNPQEKNEYEISKKKNTRTQGSQINKIIQLPNEKLISIDNAYISLYSNDLELVKEKKINTPMIDIIIINKKKFACAAPIKKSIIYFDLEKLNQESEIKNLKFANSLDYNNILGILNDELLFVGGCLGCIYLINIKYKEFVANVKLPNEKDIITSVYNLSNGDLLCGRSLAIDDDNKLVEVKSDLVQYQYKQYQNSFREISNKKGIHTNIIRNIKEIVNHKDMKEVITISFDGTILIWN